MNPYSTRRLGWVAALSTVLLAGCFGRSAEEDVSAAREALQKGDRNTAIIQLKSGLQKKDMADARYLLARALYESGNLAAAEIELEKATKLGFSETSLTPLRARLLLARGKSAEVVERFSTKQLNGTTEQVDLMTTVASALNLEGKGAQAMQTVDEALKLDPSSRRAQLVRIQALKTASGVEAALREVDALLAKDNKDAEAWQLKGEFLSLLGKSDDAIAAFRQSISLNKKNLGAQTALITLLLIKKDVDGAAAQLKALQAAIPKNIQVEFIAAAVSLERGDIKDANERIQRVLKAAGNDPRVLQLAANIDLKQGALLEADAHLGKVLLADPGNERARLMQAQLQLRMGNAAKAESLLQPLLDAAQPSTDALSLAADIQMAQGDTKAADDYLAQVTKRKPDDVQARVSLALSSIRDGRQDRGIAELKAVAASSHEVLAEMALVNLYAQQKNFPQALQYVDAVERKLPGKPATATLRGRIDAQRGEPEKARQDFESALRVDPNYYPALAELVALDVSAGRLQDAQKRLQSFVQANPKHVKAQLVLVSLREKGGAKLEDIASTLQNLVSQMPTAVSPRLALIDVQMRRRELKLAQLAAQDAAAALPESPDIWNAVGQVQAAVGDFDQAVASLGKQINLAPNAPGAYMSLAELYLSHRDKAMAVKTLNRIFGVKPDFLPAQLMLAQLAIEDSDFSGARKIAQTVKSQRPKESAGAVVAGDIEAAQKHWDAAINEYRAALRLQASDQAAIRLHRTLLAAGNATGAKSFESDWLSAHADDVTFLSYLGESALVRQDLPQAEQRYRTILKLQANNARALNNMAWLLLQTKKPEALDYATRANAVAPNQPPYMDTLAEACARAGQIDKALEIQKQVVALRPDNASFRLSLARYYIDAGKKDAARQELTKLTAMSDKLPQQQEARKLLEKL